MKTIIALLACLAISLPALAQTGDCAAETGTSTTWEWLVVRPRDGVVEFTFYAAGLLGQSSVVLNPMYPELGADPDAELTLLADGMCQSIDSSRVTDEFSRALSLVRFNADAENVIPSYPEACAAASTTPTDPPGTAADYCRMEQFHQWLVRETWPQDTLALRSDFWDVWDWIDSGAGFNTGEKQGWLGLTVSQWTNLVNPRMNNMRAFVSATDQDAQWQTDLD